MDKERRMVVIAPDVIMKSFVIEECRETLNCWRDGAMVPAVTRELLVYYMRALRGVGLPDGQLRRWATWFTAGEKANFMPQLGTDQACLRAILMDAAVRGGATCILFAGPVFESPASPVPWVGVAEFLQNNQGQRET